MGQPGRAKRLTRKVCVTDAQIEALEDNDTGRYFTLSIYNILMKCGNCGKRMKCGTDMLTQMRYTTDIDNLLESLSMADQSNEDIVRMGTIFFDKMEERFTAEDWQDIIGDLMTEVDIDIDDFIESIDEIFSECEEYGIKDVVYSSE